jgi:hypothetical protein
MRTPVVHGRDAAIGIARDDHFARPQLRQHVVPWLRDLALVAQVNPGTAENALLLQREQRRIRVHVAVHRIRAQQAGDVSGGQGRKTFAFACVVKLLSA